MAEMVSEVFNDADADVIFRSSDGVHLHLHKVILSKVSSVFQCMFTLPNVPSPSPGPETTVQVVPVAENAVVLEDLFRLCYPMEHEQIKDLNHLRSVLDAARKYDMMFILKRLKDNLRLLAPSGALRVYCVACLTKCADVAEYAARLLLGSFKLLLPCNLPHKLEELPAMALAQLVIYHETCMSFAKGVLDDDAWMGTAILDPDLGMYEADMVPWVWLTCESCQVADEYEQPDDDDIVGQFVRPRAWWCLYRDAAKAALSSRPNHSTVTETHLMERALRQAARCTTCAPEAASHLLQYSQKAANRIDDEL
ncbi:hypothetical protein ACG7TL_004881 [Trametes sanguinea]